MTALSMLGGLTLAAASGPARADLKLCNDSSGQIGIAIGYQDPQGWATEGWWNVPPNQCETLLRGTLTSRFYYVHAVDYTRGGEWVGQAFMCTDDRIFTIRGIQDCQKRGYKRTGFFEVDTGDSKDWTIRLSDQPEAAKGK